jgi:hypothetical protein
VCVMKKIDEQANTWLFKVVIFSSWRASNRVNGLQSDRPILKAWRADALAHIPTITPRAVSDGASKATC